jgi:hypothetical protein
MTRRLAAFCFAIAVPAAAAAQTTLTPRSVFEDTITTTAANGTTQPVHVVVQSWEIPKKNGTAYDLPLTGFYLAHLQSGDIATTIDGETTERQPGSFWTVKNGATMQVKVLGEFAVIETTAPTRQ